MSAGSVYGELANHSPQADENRNKIKRRMNKPQKPLEELLSGLTGIFRKPAISRGLLITGIALDSREIQAGNLFVALTGGHRDGHSFIEDAIQKGAAAVVGSVIQKEIPVPYCYVEDTRLALAQLSSSFYEHPGRKMTVIGVTGTDGKTTTTNLIFKILQSAGFKTGMVSTVNAIIGSEVIDTGFHVTTPEAPMVQQLLARMVEKGITHVVLETTSHGLDQKRVAECEFDLAVFTNITHEHLDYHGTYEKYLQSKAQLIREVGKTAIKKFSNPRLVVINYDDISYPLLDRLLNEEKLSQVKRIAYSCISKNDYYATRISSSSSGISFDLHHQEKTWPIKSQLIGAYNAANILAAFSACVEGLGVEPGQAMQGILSLSSVPGRGERIEMGQDFIAMVDFAHTPNALKVSLENSRQLTQGRLIAVFGSAGLRDKAKRRMMAEVSIKLADVTILTAEDPRTEKLDDILNEMADAAHQQGGRQGETYYCIPDRGDAIQEAINMARPGDLVIACGKGHEQSMCFGATEYPWDDRTAMKAALSTRMGTAGPQMPYLPTREDSIKKGQP
jgi:UDP-N-acetylmuramoyl-L-alanyl-D-glutamate--2,6-diaminopimelate ligase